MDRTNYYAILGVDSQASAESIKAAFKKLALQYHPDVYKGADAAERMRELLQAYQTLSDSESRQAYDARILGKKPASKASAHSSRTQEERSRREKSYAFPDLSSTPVSTIAFQLGEIEYQLSSAQAETLRWDSVLRGVMREPAVTARGVLYSCHRCNHQWAVPSSLRGSAAGPQTCPSCYARDWADYLLLRCIHCQAVFESREITDPLRSGSLYHPYELYPLCPHCRRSQWCVAENERVARMRAATARRSMLLWGSALGVGLLVIVLLAFMLLR